MVSRCCTVKKAEGSPRADAPSLESQPWATYFCICTSQIGLFWLQKQLLQLSGQHGQAQV
ncbi:hypothetical protein DUNSADRAFT_8195 [Dunaliella salina]|uniref:Encoded protein n=1 Tax=Dunaliella salina TaxID=3046 RepID=A0ABQ7GJV4_DUNSA|nr:hypothetical protein DUNSADRAFT_8195 [Dunaliella salina]|eukprot:KAF5834891.1 hypothetical protein DUNSADRAFT_8195 [Dunaliella salina]